ncbi:dermonecrotic toxin LspaSicTox-alphaIA1i [Caerostris darwini]|uniref:Dermonecrotic toxin LspaSicTox-alphaIA1i n=1 Tax=Caerostris darwini TaxID=1538125 RepID=A0AAV4Q799_9ARAC|nr:dermonecrotic toxin LspaSicTox-alphaIA1i [Caerostris darwini]
MQYLEKAIVFTLLVVSLGLVSCSGQRPFYVIGHMVNSIGQIKEFLNEGSNVLEADVQFFSNGSIKELYHGFPCDCGRLCGFKANLRDYLKYIRNITDPNSKDSNYYTQMTMQFFDLKLDTSNNKTESGRDLAKHILNYLWSENRDREQEVRALIYIDEIIWKDALVGFLDEFQRQGQTSRLKDIGFDGGRSDLSDIKQTFVGLNIQNIWQGDGIANCFTFIKSCKRLKEEFADRDSNKGFIEKVYQWTIDSKLLMRTALRLSVDGFITNRPKSLIQVLQEPEFEMDFRVASVKDNPFEKYTRE